MTESQINLDNIDFGAGPEKKDPPPKTNSRKSTGNPVGRPGRDAKIKELNETLKGMLFLANLGLAGRDVHEVYDDNEQFLGYTSCFSVYVELDKNGMPKLTPAGAAFVSAAANIIIDNSFLMKVLNSADSGGKWLALAMALQPLVLTVITNHSFGRRQNDVQAQVS
jgi:hypothetical protein